MVLGKLTKLFCKKSTLIILVGKPGSGKTHVAEQFIRRHNFAHINSDRVRAQYFPNPTFSPQERKQVYTKIHEVISKSLQAGRDVIFDGNLLTNESRRQALKKYRSMGTRVLFVFLNIPQEAALEQALARTDSPDGLYSVMPEERVHIECIKSLSNLQRT